MMVEVQDVLIVGQGIAGTAIHHALSTRGIRAVVADIGLTGASSKVAAGIINPITGSNYVLSWNFATLLDHLVPFYRSLEDKLGAGLLTSLSLYRYLPILKDVNNWLYRSDQAGNEAYYGELKTGLEFYPAERSQEVFGTVANAYRCDLNLLLTLYRNWLRENNLLVNEVFYYQDMKVTKDTIRWKNAMFSHVIFCEGNRVVSNPYFSYLPVKGLKGEALLVRSKSEQSQTMLKRKGMMSPFAEGIDWYGATLTNTFENDGPTDEGFRELEVKYMNDFGVVPDVVQHLAGIRPTVPDRKPLVGVHPQFNGLAILNGLGTKGASLAPWVATHLTDYILVGKPLPASVDIVRYRGLLV